jgi:hypothetical protein
VNDVTKNKFFFDARLIVRYSTRATARACNLRTQQQQHHTMTTDPRRLFTSLTGYSNNQPSTRGPQGDPEGPTDQDLADSSKQNASCGVRDISTMVVIFVMRFLTLRHAMSQWSKPTTGYRRATAAYCIRSIIAAMIIVAQFCFVRSVFLFSLQINFLTRKLPGRIRTRFLQEK